MTNPDDRRTPQERAYDPAEQASDETVQWARPADDATRQMEPVDAPDQPTQQYYTADPHQAYGAAANPTQAYPTYDPRLDPQAPPPNATQVYPTYYGAGGYPPAGPPPGEVPPLENTPERKPGRKVGLWAAAGAGVVLLTLGVVVGLLLSGGGGDDDTTASSPRTSAAVPPPATTLPPPLGEDLEEDSDAASPLEELPGGIEDLIGRAGTAMGTITANDDGTLTLDGIGGEVVTVRTTPDTTLVSLTARDVADLEPGESVLVQGDRAEDGTVTAKLVIGTSLPDFGN